MPLTFVTDVISIPPSILQTPSSPDSPTTISSHQNTQGLKLTTLPPELQIQMIENLPLFDRASLSLTCKQLAILMQTHSLLTFPFHLPVSTFPPPQSLTDYEHDLQSFLMRLSTGWIQQPKNKSSAPIKFCPTCGKFLPISRQYWQDKALTNMVRSCGRNGAKWRRACQHFGGTYQYRIWVDRWCGDDATAGAARSKNGDIKACQISTERDWRISCPGCKVLNSSG